MMNVPQTADQHIIRIIGAPMDLGQQRRGVDMGPSAVRYAGLQDRLVRLGYAVHDIGNIDVPVVEEISGEQNVSGGSGIGGTNGISTEGRARHLPAVVAACQAIYTSMKACIQEHEFAIFLGGDHSISMGSVPSVVENHSVGVIWVDAHADFNTPETSPSGNIHGMSVAAMLGHGPRVLADIGYPGPKLQPSQVVMIGIRNLDLEERRKLSKSGVSVFTMTDIDEHGMASITRQALSRLSHLEAIHVSLDMDSLDPDYAPGVGTPVAGGLTYREAHLLMELLANSNKVRSLDIVEINPILDHANRTAEVAVDLAASLLGQRIY